MLGQDSPDPVDTQLLIRVFLALWVWPVVDPAQERALLQRVFGAAFDSDHAGAAAGLRYSTDA
jgi:hypothetical protein